ncbi:MAG: hypothetical protein JWN45_2507, partial [Acidobacteriaceae bacterium]|nr:hypothetical protein [Acidobacteriaceae bacterium]
MFENSTARNEHSASNYTRHESERTREAQPVSSNASDKPNMNSNPKNNERPNEGPTRRENENNMEDFASVLETFEAEQIAEAPQNDDHII